MEPIHSTYEDDPDMLEIVREFADDAPARAADLETRLGDGDMERLRTLAHQLKGAGGGYGFQQITDLAAELEQAVKQSMDIVVVQDRCAALCDCLRAIVVSEEG